MQYSRAHGPGRCLGGQGRSFGMFSLQTVERVGAGCAAFRFNGDIISFDRLLATVITAARSQPWPDGTFAQLRRPALKPNYPAFDNGGRCSKVLCRPSVRGHRPEIMFGVLVVVFCPDCVSG